MRPAIGPRPSRSGFTLAELAIVLFIVTLLLGGLLVPLATQYDVANTANTQKTLSETRDALVGFAVRNGYLPCPAKSSSDGNEDRAASGSCTGNKRYGFIPWVTLSVNRLDGWNQLIGYSVTPAFANSVAPFGLSTAADITIKTRDSAGNLVNLTNSGDIPAVIFSYGKNGYYATPDGAATANADSAGNNADEDINANQVAASAGGKVFVSRTQTPSGATTGELDDIVVWVSPNVLFDRMVAAGRLP